MKSSGFHFMQLKALVAYSHQRLLRARLRGSGWL